MKNLLCVVLGTMVYAVIIVFAAPYPSAAGLMLTFPALNGLGMLFTGQSSISAMAKPMLWMPVANGALCAFYIFAFLALSHTLSPIWLAWLLFIVIAVLWLLIVREEWLRAGIPKQRQLGYVLVVTFSGLLLLVISLLMAGNFGVPAPPEQDVGVLQFAWNTVLADWYKVALFSIAFATFLVSSERLGLSDAARGILAGLPLVPFCGLVSIAVGHRHDPSERIATLRGMLDGLCLGPAVAAWFVLLISTYLSSRKPFDSPSKDFLARFAAVVVGWIACGAIIAAIVRVLGVLAKGIT